jgi:hypothetical protein
MTGDASPATNPAIRPVRATPYGDIVKTSASNGSNQQGGENDGQDHHDLGHDLLGHDTGSPHQW